MLNNLIPRHPWLAFTIACFLTAATLTTGCARSGKAPTVATSTVEAEAPAVQEILWVNAEELFVEGKGWETETPFVRLPNRAQQMVTEKVWVQSQYSTGMAVRFTTNSKEIHARWPGGGALRNMAAIGVSGLDLYERVPGAEGKQAWQWVAVGKPDPKPMEQQLISFEEEKERELLLFLPLYTKCPSLEIGVLPGSTFDQPQKERTQKPIVFYGTSIVAGGCASRTGMAHTSILRRWLDHEVINLGFSGAGSMEIEIADLLGELEPSVIVIDTLPNTTTPQLEERYVPFIRRVREKHPDVPLLLVGHILGDKLPDRQEALEKALAQLESEGLTNYVYLPGGELIAGQEEGTVDGIHPTDLGFLRMAEVHYPILKELLAHKE
ncbi:MAG: SGNH/GDSL hydrolase family protein [Candidatus Sumerlaeia bacterium]|nr:SGNH/GDSL hydrolase family protein [Candidatus Sumerlaeia bacterium]